MSLSSSEAEYVALSEDVKEVVFVIQLLGSMIISVKYPLLVRVDSIGASFMASNITITCHTKHVDIRYKYAKEYVEDRIVEIVDNDSNILIKNLSAELHENRQRK